MTRLNYNYLNVTVAHKTYCIFTMNLFDIDFAKCQSVVKIVVVQLLQLIVNKQTKEKPK